MSMNRDADIVSETVQRPDQRSGAFVVGRRPTVGRDAER